MPEYCIGKVYKEGIVRHFDGHRENAFIKITGMKKIAVLFKDHSGKDLHSDIEVGDNLQQLVNIGPRNQNQIFVTQKNYFEKLQEGFNYISYPTSRNILWEQNWRSIGSSSKEYQTREQETYPKRVPYELSTNDFRCPVYACPLANTIDHENIFYPGSFYRSRKDYCVYPASGDQNFPRTYNMIGAVQDRDGKQIQLDIRLTLHNFLCLFNWHYHTIKHVCGHFDQYERELWKRFFSSQLNTSLGKNLKDCKFIEDKDKNKEKRCDISHCVRSNQFQKIHPQISSILRHYSNSIVTMFQKAGTIKMYINGIRAFGENDVYFIIELRSITNLSGGYSFFAELVGTCFERPDGKEICHMHVHPITAFIFNEKDFRRKLKIYCKNREDRDHVLLRWGSGEIRFNGDNRE